MTDGKDNESVMGIGDKISEQHGVIKLSKKANIISLLKKIIVVTLLVLIIYQVGYAQGQFHYAQNKIRYTIMDGIMICVLGEATK